jgi:acetylornithine deacetylase/succinyl-diaminopimelate desuccinylase-like protein
LKSTPRAHRATARTPRKRCARLLAGGIPAADLRIVAQPEFPNDGALLAVLHGQDPNARPILLLAQVDVVEAKREDWQRDPFKLVEENGWFYARGATDDKAMAAVFTDALIRFRKGGFRPRRDIKLALTCGEETPDTSNMVRWLTRNQPQALAAAFALKEGAGGELDERGKPVALQIQAGEKVYQDFKLEASDVGGHSSRPTRNNPIVRLSAALARLGAYNFPIALNGATKDYFEAQSKLAAIVPTMATGATDGRFLNASGIPTYGSSGMFHDAEGSRAHGLNERIRVKSLMDGRRFLYEVVTLYANQAD